MLVALQPEDMEKAKKYAHRALDTYRLVLQKNEGNIYAANGIGAAIAELGDYNTAEKVFMMVRLASMQYVSLFCRVKLQVAAISGPAACMVF